MSCEHCGSIEQATVCQACLDEDGDTLRSLKRRLYRAGRDVQRRDAAIAELRAALAAAREWIPESHWVGGTRGHVAIARIDALLEKTKP
jgi:hypothetical protein